MNVNWPKWNTIAQFIIAVLILVTVYVAYRNILQQGEFNRNSLRPWVYVKELRQPQAKQTNADTVCVMFDYSLKNVGKTPALNVRAFSIFSIYGKKFPEDILKKKIVESKMLGIIFPDQLLFPTSNTIFRKPITMDTILKKITDDSAYVHIYVEYSNNSGELMACRYRFFVKFREILDEKTFSFDWVLDSTSVEPIK